MNKAMESATGLSGVFENCIFSQSIRPELTVRSIV